MSEHFNNVLSFFGSSKEVNSKIISAALYIDNNGLPPQRKSKTYFVIVNNKKYPTVYLLDVAIFLATQQSKITKYKQNSIQANRFFENVGFETLYSPDIGDIQNEEYVSEKEGDTTLKLHKSRERDSKLAQLVKERALKETGKLSCEVCGFDFFKVYGKIGKGYIEAHHKVPISKLKKGAITKQSDFALVCANCHRMLHNKKDKLLTISELKSKLK